MSACIYIYIYVMSFNIRTNFSEEVTVSLLLWPAISTEKTLKANEPVMLTQYFWASFPKTRPSAAQLSLLWLQNNQPGVFLLQDLNKNLPFFFFGQEKFTISLKRYSSWKSSGTCPLAPNQATWHSDGPCTSKHSSSPFTVSYPLEAPVMD